MSCKDADIKYYLNKKNISPLEPVNPSMLIHPEDGVRVGIQASLTKAPHLEANEEIWTTLILCQLRALMTRDLSVSNAAVFRDFHSIKKRRKKLTKNSCHQK